MKKIILLLMVTLSLLMQSFTLISFATETNGYVYDPDIYSYKNTDETSSKTESTASDFLKQRAEESSKRVDEKFGPEYYGGSAYNKQKAAEEETSTVPAGEFLRQRIKKRAEEQSKKSETEQNKSLSTTNESDTKNNETMDFVINFVVIMLAFGFGIAAMVLFNKNRLVKRTHNITPPDETPNTKPQTSQKTKKERVLLSFCGIRLNKETFLWALFIICIIVAICILVDSIIVVKSTRAGISILFLCFCAWGLHIQKLDDSQNLYKKVAWIAETSHSHNYGLEEYIESEQSKLNIPEQFQIDFSNKEEKEHLTQILNAHKEHVTKYYFCGWLGESKGIYNLGNLEYYFFSLERFFSNNPGETNLYENKREYISEHYYKQQLTEYGRVYYKLRLITQLYIEANENVQKLYKSFNEESDYIIKILEKNEAEFFNSYRP